MLVVETTVSYSPYKYTLVLQATAAEIMAADSAVASFTLSGGGMMDGAMVKGPVACEYNSSGEAYFVIPVSNMYAVFSAETLNDYPTCEIDDK